MKTFIRHVMAAQEEFDLETHEIILLTGMLFDSRDSKTVVAQARRAGCRDAIISAYRKIRRAKYAPIKGEQIWQQKKKSKKH